MITSCKELFNKFNKYGGRLICNYENQECILFNNISCKINNKESSNELDLLLWNYKDTQFIKYINLKLDSLSIIKFHKLQNINSNGFIIEFFRDKNGYKICIR